MKLKALLSIIFKRVLILAAIYVPLLSGCAENQRPKIKGVSVGFMYLNTEMESHGQSSKIKGIAPVGLLNIEF